jgi:hypothetical protein
MTLYKTLKPLFRGYRMDQNFKVAYPEGFVEKKPKGKMRTYSEFDVSLQGRIMQNLLRFYWSLQ